MSARGPEVGDRTADEVTVPAGARGRRFLLACPARPGRRVACQVAPKQEEASPMTTLSPRIARPTLLAFALALALPAAAPVAVAQSVGPATGQQSMSPKQKREAARRAKQGKASGQAAAPAQYPQ